MEQEPHAGVGLAPQIAVGALAGDEAEHAQDDVGVAGFGAHAADRRPGAVAVEAEGEGGGAGAELDEEGRPTHPGAHRATTTRSTIGEAAGV
jgi:hypothetical protein